MSELKFNQNIIEYLYTNYSCCKNLLKNMDIYYIDDCEERKESIRQHLRGQLRILDDLIFRFIGFENVIQDRYKCNCQRCIDIKKFIQYGKDKK